MIKDQLKQVYIATNHRTQQFQKVRNENILIIKLKYQLGTMKCLKNIGYIHHSDMFENSVNVVCQKIRQ